MLCVLKQVHNIFTSDKILFRVPVYLKGDITLLAINLYNSTAGLLLQGSLMELDKDVYFLTPDPLDWDLESK